MTVGPHGPSRSVQTPLSIADMGPVDSLKPDEYPTHTQQKHWTLLAPVLLLFQLNSINLQNGVGHEWCPQGDQPCAPETY